MAHKDISARRRREGDYHTPEPFASLSHAYLATVLGPRWQDEYVVYDPCAGLGNLERNLFNKDRLYMSTLSADDVNAMKADPCFNGATVFQFDFLNDPVELMPAGLRDAFATGKVVFLMNPPYGAAGCAPVGGVGIAKVGITNTAVNTEMKRAGRDLFVQFLYRAWKLCPTAIIGMYSTTNFVIRPGLERARDLLPCSMANGFMFPSTVFPRITAKWPVLFSVLVPGKDKLCHYNTADIVDKDGSVIGIKHFLRPNNGKEPLPDWFKRPKNTEPSVPMSSALNIRKDGNVRLDKLAAKALGYVKLSGNDPMHSTDCCLTSAANGHAHGSSVIAENFEKAMTSLAVRKLVASTWLNNQDQFSVPQLNSWFKRPPCKGVPAVPLKSALNIVEEGSTVYFKELPECALGMGVSDCNDPMHSGLTCFVTSAASDPGSFVLDETTFEKGMAVMAVRRLIKDTWVNHQDQFSVPHTTPSEEFFTDCVVWNLFSGHNQTSSFTAEYKGERRLIDNQFFPFERDEHTTLPRAPGGETYVAAWLRTRKAILSDEATQLLDAGYAVYRLFFDNVEKLELGKWKIENDIPGWYQIRNAIKALPEALPLLKAVTVAHKAMKEKLIPKVYEFNFLQQDIIYDEPLLTYGSGK